MPRSRFHRLESTRCRPGCSQGWVGAGGGRESRQRGEFARGSGRDPSPAERLPAAHRHRRRRLLSPAGSAAAATPARLPRAALRGRPGVRPGPQRSPRGRGDRGSSAPAGLRAPPLPSLPPLRDSPKRNLKISPNALLFFAKDKCGARAGSPRAS